MAAGPYSADFLVRFRALSGPMLAVFWGRERACVPPCPRPPVRCTLLSPRAAQMQTGLHLPSIACERSYGLSRLTAEDGCSPTRAVVTSHSLPLGFSQADDDRWGRCLAGSLRFDNAPHKRAFRRMPATVFGQNYNANYAPLTDRAGKLTGALFVGVPK